VDGGMFFPFVVDRVPAAGILNLSLLVLAVHDSKPKSKHTANPDPDPDPNPIPNRNTYSLLQSGR